MRLLLLGFDAVGVIGMFGMVIAMGACCLGIPLLLSGAITAGALLGGLPWVAAAVAVGFVAWAAWRIAKNRRVPAAEEDRCAPGTGPARR